MTQDIYAQCSIDRLIGMNMVIAEHQYNENYYIDSELIMMVVKN